MTAPPTSQYPHQASLGDDVRQLIPSDLMARYLAFLATRRRPLTVISYTSDLNQFRRFLRGQQIHRKGDVGPEVLDRYLRWMKTQYYTTATIERRLQSLQSFFRWAAERGYLRASPFLVWEIPRAPMPEPRPLTAEEDLRLLRLFDPWPRTRYDHMVILGVRMARFAGLRRGECNRLTWPDVDLLKGTAYIRHSKGDRDRAVPLPPRGLLGPLRDYWQNRDRPSRGVILTGLSNRPLPDKALSQAVRRLYRAASIVGATFHALRTTYATRLLEHGVDVRTIQLLLGHQSLDTTMRYLGVTDTRKKEAVQHLDADLPE